MREDLIVTEATAADWDQVVAWAAQEGWNPGPGDAACFHPTDPAGFHVGRVGGRIVSSVSIVTYSPDYAFLGFYLVHPQHRATGLGLATWTAAMPYAGDRVIGLDAVPAQEATYVRAGFTPSYRNVRYTGRPRRNSPPAPGAAGTALPVGPRHFDTVAAYDRRCFPADRRGFLARWLSAPGHTARVLLQDGRVTGYGVIRPAHVGWRMGPLFADTPEGAATLFDALTAGLAPDAEVAVDIPDLHPAAGELAAGRGLTATSHCVRMYSGPVPATDTAAVYATTTLELG